MILPPFVFTEPQELAAAVVQIAHVRPDRALELANASCAMGEDFNIDPAWLCAVALGETPTLRPTVKDGVCQVVGDKSGTIWGSVFSAAQLYARIVQKHGRHNAHLIYGCGMDRCGGKWTRQGLHKIAVWKRLRRRLHIMPQAYTSSLKCSSSSLIAAHHGACSPPMPEQAPQCGVVSRSSRSTSASSRWARSSCTQRVASSS